MKVGKNDLGDFRESGYSPFRPPPSSFRHFVRYWLPLIVYGLFIFSISSVKPPLDLAPIENADKAAHICLYGLLGALFFRAYRSRWPSASAWSMANASLFSAGFYGLTDEIHQYFVPSRSADPWDWLADMIGAMLGVASYHAWLWVQARRASTSLPCD